MGLLNPKFAFVEKFKQCKFTETAEKVLAIIIAAKKTHKQNDTKVVLDPKVRGGPNKHF